MKAGWQVRPLAEIADCCLGKMLDKQKNRGERQTYLRNVNVRWFEFDLSDLLEMPFEANEHERYSVRKGDLVICEGGYPGRCAIWEDDEPVFFQKALHRVRCHEPERARWIQYLLWMSDADGSLRSHFTGSGIQHFTGQALARLKVPLPPLEEQRRIVAVLDEAFAAIATATANAEKNLANARELFENSTSALLNGSEWPTCSLDEVCAITSKLVDPRLPNFIDLPHVGAGNIESRTGAISSVMTAREEKLISGKFLFDASTVLYSKIRPYLMKTCRPDFAGLCSADVYPLTTVADKLDRDFLFHVLMSREFTAYAEAGSARSGMPKVNRDHLFAYQISLPAIEVQRQIAERIDAFADGCAQVSSLQETKLAALAKLKQSLLRRAFTGELTAAMPETIAA